MRFASALARGVQPRDLVRNLLPDLTDGAAGSPDMLLLFYSGAAQEVAPEVAAVLQAELAPACALGVSCESVVGGDQEVERSPAVAALVAHLPGAILRPFHLGGGEWERILKDDERLQQRVGTGEDHRGHLILADPFTTPIEPLMGRLDSLLATPTFGGMASGAHQPGSNLLLLNGRQYQEGAIGIGFGGSLRIDMVVSQGCRPIGEPMVVTRSEKNILLELGRRPALQAAEEMLRNLSEEDRQALRRSVLMIGVVINEYQSEFRRGDFLIRSLVGADQDSGTIAVGDLVRPGQTVQFHMRDAATAREDLEGLLASYADATPPAGGLLFSCNGRGTRMFSEPHHDIGCIRRILPGLPVAGFFAMGELGPVGGRSFIHGHTASVALFSPEVGG